MRNSEYRDLLERFRAQGELIDEGSFAWDFDRALELLPHYQLAGDLDFLLRLVASAVAGSARMFWVGKIGSEFEIGWDGRVPTLEELSRLFPSVLSGDARLSELAIALSAASRLFAVIELRISDGLLLLDDGKLTLMSNEQKSTMGLELSLKGRSGLKFLPFFKNLKQLSILARRCSNAPLVWNLPMGVNAPKSKLKGELIRFGMMGKARGETLYYRHTEPAMGCGCLQIGDGKTNGTLVHLGIDHTLKKHEVDAPGTLIWWYSGLPLDLSRNLVRGSEFNAFCAWLNEEVETALKELLAENPEPAVRETIQEWLRWKSERGSEDSDSLRAAVLVQGCQSYIRSGHYREALLCAEQALDLEEDNLSWVAICLGLLGEFEEAVGYYEQALKSRPEDSTIRANYAEDLDLAGRIDEAMEQVEFALALDPENAHALALKARFLATRSAEEALQLIDEALALPGCPASAWETRGELCLALGQISEARSDLEKFVELAEPETLWENDLDGRLERAEEIVRQLKIDLDR